MTTGVLEDSSKTSGRRCRIGAVVFVAGVRPSARAAPGARLFPEAGPDLALDLVESRVDSKGVTIQVFRPAGRPQYATA
jgi:hypothetical protein